MRSISKVINPVGLRQITCINILNCSWNLKIVLSSGNFQSWTRAPHRHVPAIAFIGILQLVSPVANILDKCMKNISKLVKMASMGQYRNKFRYWYPYHCLIAHLVLQNSFAHLLLTQLSLWLSEEFSTLRLQFNRFSVKYRFPFPILRFLPQNHLASLKDRFLKKYDYKRRYYTRQPFLQPKI